MAKKRIKGGIHPLVLRLVVFLAVVLVLFPVLFSFFFPGNFFNGLFAGLFVSRFLWLSAIAVSLFVFLALAAGKKLSFGFDKRKSLYFFVASLALFSLYSFTLSDFGSVLGEGVDVGGSFSPPTLPPDLNTGPFRGPLIASAVGGGVINLDSSRLFGHGLFTDSLQTEDIFLQQRDQRLRKEIYLAAVPGGDLNFRWQGVWRGSLFYDNVFNPHTSVFLQVNGHDYNVTGQYNSLPAHANGWLEATVKREHLKEGVNKLEFIAFTREGVPESIGVVMAKGVVHGNSSLFDGSTWVPLDGEILLYGAQSNNILFSVLFRLGFILKFAAIIFLFLAVFGLAFAGFAVSKLRKEIVFSTVVAAVIYWFALAVEQSTRLLAESTTFFVYFLLRVSGFGASFELQGLHMVVQLAQFSVRISEASAGANNVVYFLIAFSVLLLFNWKYVNLKRALPMYIPGVFGAFLVNVLRLYIIMILGAFFTRDLARALNEATSLVVFVAYFVLFWYLTLGFMEKGVKGLRKKLRIRA